MIRHQVEAVQRRVTATSIIYRCVSSCIDSRWPSGSTQGVVTFMTSKTWILSPLDYVCFESVTQLAQFGMPVNFNQVYNVKINA
jgi:hypothetical protein